MAGATEVYKRLHFNEGDVIIQQGSKGSDAYLVQSGSVRVTVDRNGEIIQLDRLLPGQIFGEMALVSYGMRTASVIAAESCNIIVITKKILEDKLQKSDPMVRALVPMLMKRIEKTNKNLLNDQSSLDGMTGLAKQIYINLSEELSPQEQKGLDDVVKPSLNSFLDSIQEYRKRSED